MKLFFDTETTGKAEFRLPFDHPSQPRIVQLGAILCDNDRRTVGEINLIIRPDGWNIPREASDIHGITTERACACGIDIDLVIGLFATLCARAELLVAHNIDFDRLMIRAEMARLNYSTASKAIAATTPTFCTMQSSTNLCKLPGNYGKHKWPKLQEAHKHFLGREFEGAHDAMADVRACRDVYYAMTKAAP